jgi:hypothetical protein
MAASAQPQRSDPPPPPPDRVAPAPSTVGTAASATAPQPVSPAPAPTTAPSALAATAPAPKPPALSSDLVNAENLGLLFRGRVPDARDAELVFARYDTNHDDALDESELTTLITDLYAVSIGTSKYSAGYQAKARAALQTEHGRRMVQLAVRDLIAIRDSNKNGKLEHNEFMQQLHAAQRMCAAAAARH